MFGNSNLGYKGCSLCLSVEKDFASELQREQAH